jgi:hypothetical protein
MIDKKDKELENIHKNYPGFRGKYHKTEKSKLITFNSFAKTNTLQVKSKIETK